MERVSGRVGETKTKALLNEVAILRGPVCKISKALPALLKESLQAHATNTALIEEGRPKITYKELLQRAMERSWFLREVCKVPKQSRIGLLLENCVETIEYVLASVFSGLVYVPLDVDYPKTRLEYVCNESEIKAIVFQKSYIGMANYLQWACPSVQSIICVDSQDFFAIQDVVENPLMEVELWNWVAKSAKDDIQSGGWNRAFVCQRG
jgi:acyl-CoA synthetase (AMP-forming)/AMP-acid ligase II